MIVNTQDFPRGIVQVGGSTIEWLSIEITSSGTYCSDKFSVVFPLAGISAPLTTQLLASAQTVPVKIYMGYVDNPRSVTPADLTFVLQGNADTIEIDWGQQLVTIQGRDLSSLLLDSALNSDNYYLVNLTASQLVQRIATSVGLKTDITPTSKPIGSFYSNSYYYIPNLKTNWDFLVTLAQSEDYNLYVQGDTLYFNPRAGTNTYNINYQNDPIQSTALDLVTNRRLSLAKNVVVNVMSYNQQTAQANSYSATHTALTGSGVSATTPTAARTYNFSFPNLSQAQCQSRAEALLAQIVIHAVHLTATLHGDLTLDKTRVIALNGSQTGFDQLYWPSTITHTLNATQGLLTRVVARNYPGQLRAPTS